LTEQKLFNLALLYPTPAHLPATQRLGLNLDSLRDNVHRGMDESYHRRRHNEPPAHHASQSRYPNQSTSQSSRSPAAGSGERFRPAPINTSPSAARSVGSAANYGNYYQEPSAAFSATNMPTAAMGYGTDYGHEGRAQAQGFGGYNAANMMYNVPNPSPQASVYDAQQFAQRQPAAMQIMTPDVTSAYFNAEAGGGSAANMQPSAQSSAVTTNVYQQTPSMSYGSMSGVNTVQQTPSNADVSMGDDQAYADGALQEKWNNYQRQLGTVFQDVVDDSLENAAETLLGVSTWLLSQVADLGVHIFYGTPGWRLIMLTSLTGLHLDDANLHADRIKLWDDFNHAWLALGHRQRELMAAGQHTSRSHRVMSQDTIKKMGDELIRLCDEIERHGLVDYQYGVWEDQIESGGYHSST
jgi:hypothetical protein